VVETLTQVDAVFHYVCLKMLLMGLLEENMQPFRKVAPLFPKVDEVL
jgi:hypothetical protein